MRGIMSTVVAGVGKLSRVRACSFAGVLFALTAPAALADQLGTISIDGPSARLSVDVTDPLTCSTASLDEWAPLCLQITNDAAAGDSAAYLFGGTLVYDPDRAYYDADENLVHPYHGKLTPAGTQHLATLGPSTASVELTATKEGRQSGLLVVVLNGVSEIPTGTILSVSLVADSR
jgi:hypothetical protein